MTGDRTDGISVFVVGWTGMTAGGSKRRSSIARITDCDECRWRTVVQLSELIEKTVQGLGLRHFVIGAAIAGVLFVTLILTLVKFVTR